MEILNVRQHRFFIYSALVVGAVFVVITPAYVSASGLRRQPNNLGLIGYWSFNDGRCATATESSGKANTGTLVNNPTWTTAGERAGALSFSSSSLQYVTAANGTNLHLYQQEFTIAAWIKPTTNDTNIQVIVGKGFGVTSQYRLEFNRFAGKISLSWEDSTDVMASGTTTLTPNHWYHVAAVRSGSSGNWTATVYVNGVADGAGTTAANGNSVSFATTAIGRYGGFDQEYFDGVIDEVRIYNRALAASEVARLYSSGATKIVQTGGKTAKINASEKNQLTTNLSGIWTFNGQDISGTTAFDRSTNSSNGTINGPTPISGKSGQALNFDGSDDYVSIADTTALDGVTGTGQRRTWAYWVNLDGVTENTLLTDKSAFSGQHLWSEVHTSPLVITGGVTTGGALTSTTLTANVWNHIVFTYDGTSTRLYVNGVLNAGPNAQTAPADNNNAWLIGGNSGTFSTKMKLDELRVYNRALTAAEVDILYRMGK